MFRSSALVSIRLLRDLWKDGNDSNHDLDITLEAGW
jgi:hypothetical protein